ncbi:MAG: glycosyltransferase, partial [Candidatus Aenigmatarchaeota archaeon]
REIYQIANYCRKNKIELTIFMQKPKRRIKVLADIKTGKFVKVVKIKSKYSIEIYPGIFLGIDPKISKQLRDEFEKNNFDVILLPTIGPFGIRGIKLSKEFKIPCVVFYNTDLQGCVHSYSKKIIKTEVFDEISKNILWSIMKYFFENSSLILVKNKETKKELSRQIETPVEIFSSGIDPLEFSPNFRKKHKKIRLIYVGRLSEEKNLDFLAEILNNEILPKYKNLEVWIVGDGPKKEELKKKLKAKYTGFLTGRKLSEVLASADIFLFPSKTETFGLVVLEAMASGLPVVAFNTLGPNEIIKNEKTGFLCNNDKEFVEKVKFLIENSKERETMGKMAYEEGIKHTWDEIVEKLMKNIEKLVSKNSTT